MNDPAPSRSLARSFWIPAACLVAIEIYASSFDGWGAWATAPLFLVPLVLSLAIAGAGAVQCILEFRARSTRLSSIVFTVLAALPFLWFLVRRHIV
jgi:hypothetical protein